MKFFSFYFATASSFLISHVSSYADAHNLSDAISKDQTAAIVSYIVQSGSFGATITSNQAVQGTFDVTSTNHLTKVNVNSLSFDAVVDGKPVPIVDSIKLHIVATIDNNDCQNITITEKSFESTDSLIAAGLKKFFVEHGECLVRDYIIANTGLKQYC